MYLTPAFSPFVSSNDVILPSATSTPSVGPTGATFSPLTILVASQSNDGLMWVPWILSWVLVLWLLSLMLLGSIGKGSGVPMVPGLPSRLE